ncbi:hypothetical protein ACN28S_30445 [Cystobacter fuscus]
MCLTEFQRLLAQSGAQLQMRECVVGPLLADDAVRIVLKSLGSTDAESLRQAKLIAQESLGNPLLLEELVRFFQSGRSREDGSSNGWGASLGQLFDERLRHLPEDSRRLLDLVAVAGQPISQEIAVKAAQLGDDALSTLARLRFSQFLRTRAEGERASVEVSHDRVREHVVAQLSAPMLAGYHRRLAEVLKALPDIDPEVLLIHFRGAGQLREAALQAVRAAEKAARALAFNRTAELLGLALEWSEGTVEAGFPDRRVLELRRAESLAHSGRGGEAAPLFIRLAEQAPESEWLDLQRCAVEQYLATGHLDEGLAHLDSLLGRLRLTYPRSTARALFRLLWMMLRLRVRGVEFRERLDSEIPRDTLTRIDMCWAVGKALADVEPLRGIGFQIHSLLLALDAGAASRVARGLVMLGPMQIWLGTSRGIAKGSRLLDQGMALSGGRGTRLCSASQRRS